MALTDGLVSVWHMNNDWQDSWGTNHGTATGATFDASAKLGSHAGSFDATDDRVDIDNESNFDFERTQSFSVAAWIKTSQTGTRKIFSKLNSAANWVGWDVEIDAGKVNFTLISNVFTPNYLKIRNDTAYNNNIYHLVVVTYNGSSAPSGVKIYVDNNDEALTTIQNSLSASILNNISLHIGYTPGASAFWGGLIDEGVIWNRVLSASEVAELWNGGAGMEVGAGIAGQILHGKTLRSLTMGRLII